MQQNWSKYFIVDTSVKQVRGLKFGRGFVHFLEDGSPHFSSKGENVKLFDTIEEADTEFEKISDRVAIIHLLIDQQLAPQAPIQVRVSHATVKSK